MAEPRSKQKPRLTRARIVAAALDLVDQRGVDDLSLRKLGRALGVEAMAIYFHFETKRALLAATADTLRAQLVLPSRDAASLSAGFAAAARSFRDVAVAHPRAFELVLARVEEDGPRSEWTAAAIAALVPLATVSSRAADAPDVQAAADALFHLACGAARDTAHAYSRHAGAKERATADARALALLEHGLTAILGAPATSKRGDA
jgi:AcrR family transcriptional regulator